MTVEVMEVAMEFFHRIEKKANDIIELFIEDHEVRTRITSGYDLPFRDFYDIRIVNLRIHKTADPELLLAEYRLQGIEDASQTPFDKEQLAILQFREGKIHRFKQFDRVDSRAVGPADNSRP